MLGLVLCVSVAICAAAANPLDVKGCSVPIQKGLSERQPLLLKSSGGETPIEAFHLPDKQGTLHFLTKQNLFIECPGGFITLKNESIAIRSQEITCASGSQFNVGKKKVDMTAISCTKYAKHIARFTGKKCLKKYLEAEIGFELEDGRFLRHILVCFDDKEQNTIYTRFELTREISGYQIDYPRVEFIDGGFYDVGSEKVGNLYARNVQRGNINAQLGLDAASTKYIHASNDYYLARGHLTAKTDFVYGAAQRLTFYYINAAPQWQTTNAGNWLALENSVRRFSSERDIDLEVYTGTHGVATLPNEENGEDTPIYLYVDEEDNKAIPVPQFFWKVVYDPESKAAVAFVNVNNPYRENPEEENICKNVCDQIAWVRWNADDVKAGYSYCCTVASFKKVVKTLPTFKVSGLLK